MAEINVTSWAEFVDAIAEDGAVVVLPESDEWDLTDAEPITETITVNCSEIRGNGTRIKGLTFELPAGQTNAFVNTRGLLVTSLRLLDVYFTGTDNGLIFWQNADSTAEVVFRRCAISGEMAGNASGIWLVFGQYSDFAYCAFNIACYNGGQFATGMHVALGCRFEFFTNSAVSAPFQNSISPFCRCVNCEIILTAPSASSLDFYLSGGLRKLSGCVVRGTLGAEAAVGTAGNPYSGDKISAFSTTLSATSETNTLQCRLMCTESELQSAEFLSANGFEIGDGDDEWHTGNFEINAGYPYIPDMLDLPKLDLRPVPQNDYISVFDITTPQNGFNGNGLAILCPTECTVTETLNGAWTFAMTHPVDPEGKWEFLQLRNIVRIDGQLFTILAVDIDYTDNSGIVRATGEHIWYQQADSWIFPTQTISSNGQTLVTASTDSVVIEGFTGQQFLNAVDARTSTFAAQTGGIVYHFTHTSDLIPDAGKDLFNNLITKDVGDGCTPIDAIIGSGGLIDQSPTGSAELYRDNFYFSVNTRMENASDNAFDIRVGRDLRGIKRNFDTSNFVSYFGAYDGDTGSYWAVSWVISEWLKNKVFPHHIIRSKTFSGQNVNQNGWGGLIAKGMSFFRRNCKPVIGYEIDLEDVRNNQDFSVMASERLKVGDQGNLYDVRLGGNLTIKISETVYDAVRNKVTKITVGDKLSFTAPAASTVEIEPEVVGGELWLMDADGNLMYDADGYKMVEELGG